MPIARTPLPLYTSSASSRGRPNVEEAALIISETNQFFRIWHRRESTRPRRVKAGEYRSESISGYSLQVTPSFSGRWESNATRYV